MEHNLFCNRNLKKAKDKVIDILFNYFWLIILLIGALFFIREFKIIFLIFLLIAIGGFSYIYRLFIPISIGIELITPFTFLINYLVNPFIGWICASAMIIIAAFVSKRFCYYTAVKILIYGIICFLFAGLITNLGFLLTGKILVIVLNVLYIIANIIFHDLRSIADLPGNIVNIVFVWLVLTGINSLL